MLKHAPTSDLLTLAELEALDKRIAAGADQWLKEAETKPVPRVLETKDARGRKGKVVVNPFSGLIVKDAAESELAPDLTTLRKDNGDVSWDQYPAWAMDIVEGIARLDWHDRPIGVGGKSMPLSVNRIMLIMDALPSISTAAVQLLLNLGDRHARRYVRATELMMPHLIRSRPEAPIAEPDEVEHDASEAAEVSWMEVDELPPPSAEVLAKLHWDLRDMPGFAGLSNEDLDKLDAAVNVGAGTNVIVLPARREHPQRRKALALLAEGLSVRAVARQLGVSVNSVIKWRDEAKVA